MPSAPQEIQQPGGRFVRKAHAGDEGGNDSEAKEDSDIDGHWKVCPEGWGKTANEGVFEQIDSISEGINGGNDF